MKRIAIIVMVCSIALFTSGCDKQEPCVPIVKMVKPNRVHVDVAKIEQCRYADTIDNVKCVMKNYVNVKSERDQLRSAYESVTE